MILIKSIDFMEVEEDPRQIIKNIGSPYDAIEVITSDGVEHVKASVVEEWVHGQRFTKPNGHTVIIGMDQSAQDLIGIQYEAWENMSSLCEKYRMDSISANRSLSTITAASLWTRLIWLFRGCNA